MKLSINTEKSSVKIFSQLFRRVNSKIYTNLCCERLRSLTMLRTPAKDVVEIKHSQEPQKILSEININDSINETMQIGQGGEAAVYRIKDTDYVIRLPHIEDENDFIYYKRLNVDMKQLDFNVTAQDKVNHIVAKIGESQIMRYIPGENTIMGGRSNPKIKKAIVEAIDTLPLASVKDYIYTLIKANRLGMMHDYTSPNCIIDINKKTITPIDFGEGRESAHLSSLMLQCGKDLDNKQKNNLLRKGVQSILELIRDDKASINEMDLSVAEFQEISRELRFMHDKTYFMKIEDLCYSLCQDSSKRNVNRLLAELKNM